MPLSFWRSVTPTKASKHQSKKGGDFSPLSRGFGFLYVWYFFPFFFQGKRDGPLDYQLTCTDVETSQSVNGVKSVRTRSSSAKSSFLCFVIFWIVFDLCYRGRMLISYAMTMTSPVELAGKTGWFDSLRRNRRNKSLGSTDKLNSKTMTGAKSLSSLHTMVVQQQQPTRLVSPLDTSPSGKSTWRSILSRPRKTGVHFNSNLSQVVVKCNGDASSPHPALQVPLPVVEEQVDDKNLSPAFCTLPRKRGQQTQQDGGRSLPPHGSTSSRTRSYSITSLDRRNKRSTVWYTHSESDILNRRVSLFLLGRHRKKTKFLLFLSTARYVPTP